MDINQQLTAIESHNLAAEAEKNLKKAILHFLELKEGGASDFEMMEYFGKPRNVVSAARNALYREGSIRLLDTKKTDKSSGRKVCVWKFDPDAVPPEEKSAKMILTEIRKIFQNVEKGRSFVFSIDKGKAYDEIKDLVFSKQAIILPLNQANGTE